MYANTLRVIAFLPLFLLVTSCGKQATAEDVVNDFIDANALHPEKILQREFQRLDSTKFLNDTIVLEMQSNGSELYKTDIDYKVKTSGRMLYFLRLKYVYEGDTLRNTFYLDEQLENVVSFK